MDPKDEIKSRTDIAELIGEYLVLKPAGPSRFRALCPFHSERTPSFHVSADKQIWHCFGCGEGGDCFAFVMRMEGMDFPEALLHLGKRAGVEVTRFSAAETNEKRRLLDANALAGKYFRKALLDAPAGAAARAYVEKRGISSELGERFGLGFAPDSWDALTGFLGTRGYAPTETERAGLALRRKDGSGVYDRFRNRLMIPLCDAHGNVIGFVGRVLPGSPEDAAKYMNSPETAIYRKGHTLYGLHLAKQAIKREGKVVIVEGNLDVVASHKAGVEYVVGSSGTALTEEQLALLKRFTTTVVFSFDADAAGFKAAQRGIALARAAGFDVRAAVLPEGAGKDPDEVVQRDPSLWRGAVEHTVPIMRFLIDRAVVGRDLANVDDKREVARLVLPELAGIHDVVEREHWLRTVADLLRTDMGALRSGLGDVGTGSQGGEKRGAQMAQGAQRAEGGNKQENQKIQETKPQMTREGRAFRSLLAYALQAAELRGMILGAAAGVRIAPDETLASLYTAMRAEYDANQSADPSPASYFVRTNARIAGHAPLVRAFEDIALYGEELAASASSDQLAAQVRELIDSITVSDRDRRRKEIEADMRRAEEAGDHEAVQRLIREFNALR